ncbi:hypothetical protein B566_EDAN015215, partial [Ephemera danica]
MIAVPPSRAPVPRTSRTNRFLQQHKRASLEREQQASSDMPRIMARTVRKRRSHDKDTDREPKADGKRAGKIEPTDWNMAVIERKIEENRFGRTKGKGTEKVPKWSREKFTDKLRSKSSKEDAEAAKFAEIDDTLRRLDRKIREGSSLDTPGPRGANKVSAMAEQLATKLEPAAEQTIVPVQKSSSRNAVVLPQQGVSEFCHFCGKRVYLMERLSAEGRFFHRGCFRCEYCGTSLRPRARARRKSEDLRAVAAAEKIGETHLWRMAHELQRQQEQLEEKQRLLEERGVELEKALRGEDTSASASGGEVALLQEWFELMRERSELRRYERELGVRMQELELQDRHAKLQTELRERMALDDSGLARTVGVTPERVEFENLAGSEDDLSEARPASGLAEMDEEAWTDHNFGASCADDDSSSGEEDATTSDSEEEDAEAFEEALEEPLSVEQTRQLAASWQRRHSQRSAPAPGETSEISDDDPCSSEGEWSCERDEIEDEDSSTATEGDAVARELLKQEQRLRERALRRRRRSQGSDTEVIVNNNEATNEGDLQELNEFLDTLDSPNVDTAEALKPSELFNKPREIKKPAKFPVRSPPTRPVDKEMDKLTPMLTKAKISELPKVAKVSETGEKASKHKHKKDKDDKCKVASDCTSTESDSEEEIEEEEEENLATEIETDSEFELDNSLPTIIVDSELQVCTVKSVVRGNLGSKPTPATNKMTPTRKPQPKPSVPPPEMTPAVLRHRPNNFPGLDLTLKQKELLNRTHSTEGIASKMSLELKKRYLLGGEGLAFNKNVQKSGSASALDSRFRSFVDQISEQQKLLQPAASPSPTMQAFLDKSPSKTASPLLTSMSTSNILQGNRAETVSKLPKVPSSFVHICGKKETVLLTPPEIKITPEIDDEVTPIVENKDIIAELDLKKSDLENEDDKESEKISDLEKEKNEEETTPCVEVKEIVETNILDPDYRPRSPAHETSIIVPDISVWKDKETEEQEEEEEKSDESSEESESEYDDSVEELPKITNVPQLEITDSEGVKIKANDDLSPDKPEEFALETELSDWAAEENSVGDFDEFQIDTRNITFRRGKTPSGNPTLALEDDLSEPLDDVPKVDIMIVSETKTEIKQNDIGSENCPKVDVMTVTETVTKDESMTAIGATIQDIDFMDSGDEVSELDTSSSPEKAKVSSETKNIALIEGYIQLSEDANHELVVPANDSSTTESISKSSDDFGTTPDTELENLVLVEAINAKLAKTSDEESLLLVDTDTTISDVTTLVLNNVNQNVSCNQTSRPFIDPSYEAHVKRLQGRISPFSNAKDSIDIRKSRKSSSSSTPSPSHSAKDDLKKSPAKTVVQNGTKFDHVNNVIIPESPVICLKDFKTNENVKLKEESPTIKIIPNTPSTSRKLEEISKERSKQKDLIADLVIGKLGTNSLERKRSLSGGPGIRKRLSSRSPTGSPRCSLIGPPVPPPPPPEEMSPPVPPPPMHFPSRATEPIPRYAAKPPLSPSKKQNVIDYDDDVFVTPMKFEKPKERPISVYASFKAPESKTKLPETPLTHPETFSCPDIRRALFVEDSREKARQEARARARLLSDQELGLSPEDAARSSSLRDKARRRFNDENDTPVAPPRMKKKSDSKFYTDDTSIEETKTDPIVVKRSNKKPKDRERRRSLIQAMSGFFSRKKDSSPSKESPTKSPTSKFHVKHVEDLPPPLPPPPQGYQGCQSYGRDSTAAEESPSEGEDS